MNNNYKNNYYNINKLKKCSYLIKQNQKYNSNNIYRNKKQLNKNKSLFILSKIIKNNFIY